MDNFLMFNQDTMEVLALISSYLPTTIPLEAIELKNYRENHQHANKTSCPIYKYLSIESTPQKDQPKYQNKEKE